MEDIGQNITVSVVVVYTNPTKLEEAKKYLESQSIFHSAEMIFLDNRENRFSSAAKALNYGASISKGEVIVFMHQDVYLWDSALLSKYYDFLKEKPNAILGVAGVAKKDHIVYYDFCETKEKLYRGRSSNGEIMQAITLDECLFAMRKSLWDKLKFDEQTCDNWHFYGADICYNNLLNGGENIILSTDMCHESTGDAYNKYFRNSLKAMIKKYKKRLDRIETTCVNIKCSMPMFYIYALVSKTKKFIKKIIRRK